jgi:2-hydroxy-3-oxopropionate reductase
MKVGFVGLGIMGTPMAANLIKGGHELFLYSRRSVPQSLVAAGGSAYTTGREVAQEADVVVTMVPDTPVLRKNSICGIRTEYESASRGMM